MRDYRPRGHAPLRETQQEIRLLPSSPFELDRIILSAIKLKWRKMAMVVGTVHKECEAKGLEISVEDIADRIIALEEAGMIACQGDLANWRRSEVRLLPEQGG